jgi:hypothetical protein
MLARGRRKDELCLKLGGNHCFPEAANIADPINQNQPLRFAFLWAVGNNRSDTMLVLHLSCPRLQLPQVAPIRGCATLGNCLLFFDGSSSWLRNLGLAEHLLDAQDSRRPTTKHFVAAGLTLKTL